MCLLPGRAGWGVSCSTAGKLGKVSPTGHGPLWEEDDGANPKRERSGKRSSIRNGKRENTFYDNRGGKVGKLKCGNRKTKEGGSKLKWGNGKRVETGGKTFDGKGVYTNTREGIKTIFKTTFILF